MDKKTIDLEDYRLEDSRVFVGRERGIFVRKKSGIDSLVEKFEQIEVIVPSDIMSVNPSFLIGFLANVVKSLGKDKFHEKIKFISRNEKYDVNWDVEVAIDRILHSENILRREKGLEEVVELISRKENAFRSKKDFEEVVEIILNNGNAFRNKKDTKKGFPLFDDVFLGVKKIWQKW